MGDDGPGIACGGMDLEEDGLSRSATRSARGVAWGFGGRPRHETNPLCLNRGGMCGESGSQGGWGRMGMG
jgi:hypothetical protein